MGIARLALCICVVACAACGADNTVQVWQGQEIDKHETGEFLRFNLYKLNGAEKTSTLLVIGGVHGDEPGGYFAPALLATHYKITKGALWVVPNLNFESIVLTRRGLYGDMNRKFASVRADDPDYLSVNTVKEIALDPEVDLVMNLHDGHGFYRERWENTIFNPKAWGQTLVIDQKKLSDVKFGNMDEIAKRVVDKLSVHMASDHHYFRVKNTETRYKDEEMQRSLTYFAITNLKPAFGQETSKNIDALAIKVEYHLRSIEEFMHIMGIEFERDFELSYEGVQQVLNDYGTLKINDRINFSLLDLRSILRFVPLHADGSDRFIFDHPLGAVKKIGDRYDVFIGNKRISALYPQAFDGDCTLPQVSVSIDDQNGSLFSMGETFNVKKHFVIEPIDGIRANVIGFSVDGVENETGMAIAKSRLIPRFSENVRGSIYRVEFYKDNSFCGMINASFTK
ncbi:lipoprotein [Campylobacterota bacterium]|nr:lipoprotein [Campylobacterota bacterium]